MRPSGPNKDAAKSADLKALAGCDKYFSNVSSLMIEGVSYTPAELKAVFQAEIDAVQTADQGRAAYAGMVGKAHTARAKARDVRRALRSYILATFGPTAITMLQEFGMKVPAPKSPKAATKAKAVETAKATREARHTMGKKQKQAITGTQAPAMPVKQTP